MKIIIITCCSRTLRCKKKQYVSLSSSSSFGRPGRVVFVVSTRRRGRFSKNIARTKSNQKMMRPFVVVLCLATTKFQLSQEHDGLIRALTKAFARKHVQTVTAASTCWPPGDHHYHNYCRYHLFLFVYTNPNETSRAITCDVVVSAGADGQLLFGLSSADISANFRPSVIPAYGTWYKHGVLVDVSCVQTASALFAQVRDIFTIRRDYTA